MEQRHPQEACQQHHQAGSDLESPGEDPGTHVAETHPPEACQHHHQEDSDLESTGEETEGKTTWREDTLKKPASTITTKALTWNPQGKRKRGRPHGAETTAAEMPRSGHSWKELELLLLVDC